MYTTVNLMIFRPYRTSSACVMGKCCEHSSAFIFEWVFLILKGNKDITSQMSSKFGMFGPRTAELAALERLEKSP